jgi:regulator of sigma E protease
MSELIGSSVIETVFWFLIVLTPLVFVHEFGHYWVARRAGVRVEVFSIGFGRELFGITDRAGTRWKFSLIPLGGYVKMFGQNDLGPDDEGSVLSEAERAVSFHYKKLWQKAAVVVAGPLANFLFAIAVFSATYVFIGQPFTPARVAEVVPGSAAEEAGLQPGDVFIEIEGRSIQRFEEVQQLIRLHPQLPVTLVVERDGRIVSLTATPHVDTADDGAGGEQKIGLLGVRGTEREFQRHDPLTAIGQAFRETVRVVSVTLTAIGQIIAGDRGTDELGGPVRIAQMSDSAAAGGFITVIMFAAFLSINLGLINLFPIPLLDGGHLLFYAYEAVAGKPPDAAIQDVGLKIGLVLVLGLMVFATVNDIVRLPFVQQLVGLAS